MSRFSIGFDDALVDALRRVESRADGRLAEVLQEIGERGTEIAQGLAPANTGRYRDSIGFELERNAVTVGSKSRRAHLVESGRRPGPMPPPTLIADIFAVDKHEAYLIARQIGDVGTEGAAVIDFTRRAMRAEFVRLIAQLPAQLALSRND